AAATTEVMAVRAQLVALERALAEYQAMVSAAVQPFAEPLPDLHGAAREVAEKLEAAASQVGPDGKVFPPLYERASVIAARLEAAEKELPKRKFPTLQQD